MSFFYPALFLHILFLCFFFFFFSSRRRHTRFDCDWSSDVCSSDLSLWDGCRQPPHAAYPQLRRPGQGLAAYLALLRPGVAVPRLLPGARWALTPPFHPYPLEKRAVCFLWPFPSPCGAQALPGSLPYGARTFLSAPVQPAHRDHRTLPPPAGKATDRERAGASLAHQAPQQARQAVSGEPAAGRARAAARRHRLVGVEPKAIVLLEHRLAQPGRIPACEDRRRKLGGVHGVDAARPVQREQLARGALGGEEQQGAIRQREAAQQAEREPVGRRGAETERGVEVPPQPEDAAPEARAA